MTVTTTAAEIADLFGLAHDTRTASARYNVAPSQPVPVVRVTGGARELVELRWGLVPHWNNDPKPAGYVNARAETLIDKPAFRDPFRFRRCLVPAGGFYEWQTVGKRKKPHFFRHAGGGPLVFAAVWDRWQGPNGAVESVAVLTVPANDLVRPLHDRMPAVLARDQFAAWLDPRATPADLLPLLRPFPAGRMEGWPVSDRVNAAGVEGPALTARVEPSGPGWSQPSLFGDGA